MLARLEEFYLTYPEWIKENIPDSEEGKKRMQRLEIIFKRKLSKYLGKKIVDICCGTGIVSFVLSKMGYGVVGIDINEKMLEIAEKYRKKLNLDVRFILGDVRDIKIDEKFETGIIFGNSIIHFSPKDLEIICKKFDCKFLIFEYEDGFEILKERYRLKGFSMLIIEDYKNGKARLTAVDFKNMKKASIEIFIWTPVFLEYVLEKSGYSLVERFEEEKIYDVYEKK